MAINEKYSFKKLKNQNFTKLDAKEFNNSEIVGSNFSQENKPYSSIFPEGMTGVTFERCNMNNVDVPSGNTVSGGCNVHMKVQNDLEEWVVGKDGKPIEPFHKGEFEKYKISTDPIDIPAVKLTENIKLTKYIEMKAGIAEAERTAKEDYIAEASK